VSTDELIVQGFEWLVDYSQHFAEKLPRWPPTEPKSHAGKSLEQECGEKHSTINGSSHKFSGSANARFSQTPRSHK